MRSSSRKPMLIAMVLVFIVLLVSTGAASAQMLQAIPGRSVVGQGTLPGLPDLIIHQSGGNDVNEIVVGQQPGAYGANNPSLNYPNACLLDDDAGISDLGTGTSASKNHEYTFTFADGVSVGRFSFVLLDWGDFLPFGQNPDHRSEITVTAYDAANNVVDSETFGFTTNSAASNDRNTLEFGNLSVSGDACTAQWGEPGLHEFVMQGTGIVRVEFRFRDRASMDPNIGIDRIQYAFNDGTGTQGYWKNHDWPVDSIEIGGTTYTRDEAIAIMQHAATNDKTYSMFEQLVAAKLNIYIGNEDSCISATIAAADAWLTANPVGSGVKASSAAWKTGGASLHGTLDAYNNGLLCAEPRG